MGAYKDLAHKKSILKLEWYNGGITKCLTWYNASYNGGITDMAMSNAERQKRWLAKNRAAFNLRRRNARKKNLGLVEKESVVVSTVPRIETSNEVQPMGDWNHIVDPNPPRKTIEELREMMAKASEKPVTEVPDSVETRSAKDVVGGIYRNDNGGVISKFAWEKLQKMKAHAKENNFEIDEYSQ